MGELGLAWLGSVYLSGGEMGETGESIDKVSTHINESVYERLS